LYLTTIENYLKFFFETIEHDVKLTNNIKLGVKMNLNITRAQRAYNHSRAHCHAPDPLSKPRTEEIQGNDIKLPKEEQDIVGLRAHSYSLNQNSLNQNCSRIIMFLIRICFFAHFFFTSAHCLTFSILLKKSH
jgi:hypothetical protein